MKDRTKDFTLSVKSRPRLGIFVKSTLGSARLKSHPFDQSVDEIEERVYESGCKEEF